MSVKKKKTAKTPRLHKISTCIRAAVEHKVKRVTGEFIGPANPDLVDKDGIYQNGSACLVGFAQLGGLLIKQKGRMTLEDYEHVEYEADLEPFDGVRFGFSKKMREKTLLCPVCKRCDECGMVHGSREYKDMRTIGGLVGDHEPKGEILGDVMIELNDTHHWSIQKSLAWLESLGL